MTELQEFNLSRSNKVLVDNLLDQNTDLQTRICDIERDYELLKSRTTRTIAHLKDQVSWCKAWLGGLTICLIVSCILDIVRLVM